jgi:hypothetical protein
MVTNPEPPPITTDQISQRAFEISQQGKTFDQLVWLVAEKLLQIQTGAEPLPNQIKSIAESIANNHPKLEELHWLLAERQLILERKRRSRGLF